MASIISAQANVINCVGSVGPYAVKARLVVKERYSYGRMYYDWSGTYTYTKAGNTLNLVGEQSAESD